MGEGAATGRVAGRAQEHRIAVAIAGIAAIAIAAWPVQSIQPGVGFDWDWVAALSYAADRGLHFGEQIVFTYGPLGFLDTAHGPVLFYGDAALPWLFTAIVQLGLAATLLHLLRRSFPLGIAAVLAALVLALVPDRTVALGFALCALALTRDPDAPRDALAAATPILLGALTGLTLLGKLNAGIELLALALVWLVAASRRRGTPAFLASLLATAIAGWAASGQAASDLWPYLRYGAQVVAGYAAAMGLSDHAHRWTYAAALLVTTAALVAAWRLARDWEPRRRWGLLAAVGLYAAFDFKEGFVRQDVPHLTLYFGDALMLFAVLPVRPPRRLALVGALVGVVVVLAVIGGFSELTRRVDPVANAAAAADQVRTLASPARRAALKAELRARIQSNYGLGPQILDAVGRRPVMMWPYLFTEIAFAYDLRLRPLPTLEPYSAYTPQLDRLSAKLLASARAPTRIIRLAPSVTTGVDGRYPSFEAPLAALAIVCRYRDAAEQQSWQALARSSDRCSAPRTLSTTSAAWGKPVRVPSPRRSEALVLVRIEGANPHGFERLQSLLLRPERRWIALDEARYRLVAATAGDGLLLQAPADADFPEPFQMAPNPATITVGRDGGEPSGRLRFTFVEVSIRPAPAASSPA